MPPEPTAKPPVYSESQEEAKHPGAVLGLIMGIYPAIFIVGLLLAVGFLSLRNMAPSLPYMKNPADAEAIPPTTPQSIVQESSTQRVVP
jgi:hypothetical protein